MRYSIVIGCLAVIPALGCEQRYEIVSGGNNSYAFRLDHKTGEVCVFDSDRLGEAAFCENPKKSQQQTAYDTAYALLEHAEAVRADIEREWLNERMTKADNCLKADVMICREDRACSDRALAWYRKRAADQAAAFTKATNLPPPEGPFYATLPTDVSAQDCWTYFKQDPYANPFADLIPKTQPTPR